MRFVYFLTAFFSALLTFQSAFAWVVDDFAFQEDDAVTVFINDQAGDGCWTNLGEVKTYAEDKLELLGLEVLSSDGSDLFAGAYEYLIVLIAEREGLSCFGHFEITLGGWVDGQREFFAVGTVHEINSLIWNVSPNFNSIMLDKVSQSIDELSDLE